MLKILKNYEKIFCIFKRNKFQYMSSLPSKSGDKTLEEFIKHELLSTFLLNPKLKDILEDEDTQDESIKGWF